MPQYSRVLRPILATMIVMIWAAAALPSGRADMMHGTGGVTGNDILYLCAGKGLDYGYCMGYIMGVTDVNQQIGQPICTIGEATHGQARAIVVKYIESHPAMRGLSAAILVTSALKEAFPCPTQ